MRAQAVRFGAEMVDDDIVEADLTGGIKTVTDTAGTVHRAKTVIVATGSGSGYRKLGLPKEDELCGRGVSWCATCDGFFFRDRDIVVVGGGDTAMEEATFLTRFARSVSVVHSRSTLPSYRTPHGPGGVGRPRLPEGAVAVDPHEHPRRLDHTHRQAITAAASDCRHRPRERRQLTTHTCRQRAVGGWSAHHRGLGRHHSAPSVGENRTDGSGR
ncbi:putative NAD(P)/FAD-binding protein YdhS [Streptomyces canus]|nr:putative NAD(P)/FAD-binding protein YdhS [Streptomyces canus]